METGERLREYEAWAAGEGRYAICDHYLQHPRLKAFFARQCWPDPEGDEQRQDPDYDKEGK